MVVIVKNLLCSQRPSHLGSVHLGDKAELARHGLAQRSSHALAERFCLGFVIEDGLCLCQ